MRVKPVEPELTIIALSLWLIVLLGLTSLVYSLVLMCRFGLPVRVIVWFAVGIASTCAVLVLLAGYVQKGRGLEKASDGMEAVTFKLE